jgi:tetratricopeptide (TPR) repeat protein
LNRIGSDGGRHEGSTKLVAFAICLFWAVAAWAGQVAAVQSFGQTDALLAQAPPAGETPDVRRQINDITKQLQDTKGLVERQQWWLTRGAGFLAALLAILSFFGYSQLRDWVRGYVERRLTNAISSAVRESLPQVLADTQKRAEEYLLRLAKLLALRSHGAYDEALAEFGWDGRVASLRTETPITRQAIIECLYAAKKNRTANRSSAWEAVTELLKDDTSPESTRLYFRLVISLWKYQEGLAFYERSKDLVLSDQESGIRAATLLRKVGRLNEALDVAKRFAASDDLGVAVTVAVLQRDLGKFDEVHDVLLPQVNRLVSSTTVELPEGWHRVLNTFIANCLDREHPEDAIAAAEFVMRSAPGAVETFTVGRLILTLPESTPSRPELMNRFRDSVGRQLPGEATTRCQVILKQLEGRRDEAIALLRGAIVSQTPSPGAPIKPDVYFQRCNLATLLLEDGKPAEAIDALMPAVSATYGGEARYLLARAYAQQGEGRDAARWLRQAIDEAPKWAEHARDHAVLKRIPEVIEELAKPLAK